MRRYWAITALVAGLLAVPAVAQHHGGMSSGFAGHSGVSSHGSMTMGHASSFSGFQHTGTVHSTETLHSDGFRHSDGFHHSNGFRHRRFFYGYYPWYSYGYSGYYGYSGDYGYPWNYGDYSYLNAPNPYPTYDMAYAQNNAIEQQEIDRLENEVDRLREERDARASAAAPESRKETTAQASEPTVLVFRNGHKEEVKNYAIVGETLWVFSELRARKIPLADLDIDATTKANEDRGVEFSAPKITSD
jgi:hypothetical protein